MNPALLQFTGPRTLRAEALDQDAWTQVRHGAFYPASEWEALDAGERHALLVHAGVPKWAEDRLVSHWSAAALHGLPTIGRWPNRVDVMVAGRGRTSQHVQRFHRVKELPTPVQINGIRVTDPLRTVVDLARCTSLRSALATADAALRKKMFAIEALRQAVSELPTGVRGKQTALLVAQLADERAESPLESMSRAVMFQARLPRPELQVVVRDGRGFIGRCDFGWDGLVGECDGKMKYGADLTDDPSAAVWREKQREDRIRRVADLARWCWDDAYAEGPMLRILADKGVRPRPGQQWIA